MRSKLANTHVRLKQSGPGKQVSQVQSHLQPSLDSFLLLLVGRLVDGEDDVAGLGLGSKRTFGRAKSGSIGDLFIKSAVPKQGGERANQEVLEDASSDRVSEELSDTNIGSLEHDISNIHVLLEKGMGDGERRLLSELGKGLERMNRQYIWIRTCSVLTKSHLFCLRSLIKLFSTTAHTPTPSCKPSTPIPRVASKTRPSEESKVGSMIPLTKL